MRTAARATILAFILVGCSKTGGGSSVGRERGLPKEQGAPPAPRTAHVGATSVDDDGLEQDDPHAAMGGGAGANPHAGLDMGGGGAGADPHAGLDMGVGGAGADPHAGLDMGAGGAGADPHAGLDMGAGGAGGAGADPHAGLGTGATARQPVDPSKFLRGTIVATDETAPLIKKGAILFLSVKPVEPLSGDIIGSTLAVDRVDIDHLPVTFELTGANQMRPTTKFEGDVVINARIDQDGEARSSQPGDIEGSVRVKIPADSITLKLDRVVR